MPQGTGGARLLRRPQEIFLNEVCAAVNDAEPPSIFGIHANPSNLCPVGRGIPSVLEASYHALGDTVLERMRTISLQNILDDASQKRTMDISQKTKYNEPKKPFAAVEQAFLQQAFWQRYFCMQRYALAGQDTVCQDPGAVFRLRFFFCTKGA